MLVPPASFGARGTSMINTVRNLSLTTSLQLCLDAGDLNSYDGSSQTWKDLSGNGYDFYRGSGSGSDGFDPTFNGVAGRQSSSEYFTSDGGDAFWQTASHGFMTSWHKDNCTFTVIGWVWIPAGVASPPGYQLLADRTSSTTSVGASVQISGLASTGRISMNYLNGSGSQACVPPTNDVIVEGAWMMAAMSFSEGSGASFVRANGTSELMSSDTLVSPSAAASSSGIAIWGRSDTSGNPFDTAAGNPLAPNTARINSLMVWNRALSQAEVTSFYDTTKGKFGL